MPRVRRRQPAGAAGGCRRWRRRSRRGAARQSCRAACRSRPLRQAPQNSLTSLKDRAANGGRRPRVEVRRAAALDQPAAAEQRDAIRRCASPPRVVGDDHRGRAGLAQQVERLAAGPGRGAGRPGSRTARPSAARAAAARAPGPARPAAARRPTACADSSTAWRARPTRSSIDATTRAPFTRGSPGAGRSRHWPRRSGAERARSPETPCRRGGLRHRRRFAARPLPRR